MRDYHQILKFVIIRKTVRIMHNGKIGNKSKIKKICKNTNLLPYFFWGTAASTCKTLNRKIKYRHYLPTADIKNAYIK